MINAGPIRRLVWVGYAPAVFERKVSGDLQGRLLNPSPRGKERPRGPGEHLPAGHVRAGGRLLQGLPGAGGAPRAGRAAAAHEALDGSAVPTRNAKRRGGGRLDRQADIGWSNNLGWYEGVVLLAAVN